MRPDKVNIVALIPCKNNIVNNKNIDRLKSIIDATDSIKNLKNMYLITEPDNEEKLRYQLFGDL